MMSERYECVLVIGSRGEVIEAFHDLRSPLPIGLGELDRDMFAVYVKEGRLFNHLEDEKLAINLASKLGRALLVLYDNSCDVCHAAIYTADKGMEKAFGEEDEIWTPLVLDAQDRPIIGEERFRWDEIKDDESQEYDCIHNAVDAGLEALGVRDRLDSRSLKQKVVYEFDY
jgi:hypothetical protein